MLVEHFRWMYDFTNWANDRTLTTAAALTEEQLDEPRPYQLPSLRSIFVHMMSSEALWLERMASPGSAPNMLNPADFPRLDLIRSHWEQQRENFRNYLGRLTDGTVNGPIRYSRPSTGQVFESSAAELISQLFQHAAQHRSEAAVILTELGHSPGELGILTYMREKSQG